MNRALFLDRDGIITKLVYDLKSGTVDTVRNPKQVELVFGIAELLKKAKRLGYLNIVISNQPGIGLGKLNKKTFESINNRVQTLLQKDRAILDAQYYCLHHPFAQLSRYRKVCDCRKPKTGLIREAAAEFDLDLKQSWMLGDGVYDMIAGYKSGCKTIMLANIYEASYLEILERKLKNIKPTYIVKSLLTAQALI